MFRCVLASLDSASFSWPQSKMPSETRLLMIGRARYVEEFLYDQFETERQEDWSTFLLSSICLGKEKF